MWKSETNIEHYLKECPNGETADENIISITGKDCKVGKVLRFLKDIQIFVEIQIK